MCSICVQRGAAAHTVTDVSCKIIPGIVTKWKFKDIIEEHSGISPIEYWWYISFNVEMYHEAFGGWTCQAALSLCCAKNSLCASIYALRDGKCSRNASANQTNAVPVNVLVVPETMNFWPFL